MAVVPLPEVEVALPLEDSVSAEAVTLVLVKSISSIWFLTGTISFELGVTIILICVEVASSTFDIAVILMLLIFITP